MGKQRKATPSARPSAAGKFSNARRAGYGMSSNQPPWRGAVPAVPSYGMRGYGGGYIMAAKGGGNAYGGKGGGYGKGAGGGTWMFIPAGAAPPPIHGHVKGVGKSKGAGKVQTPEQAKKRKIMDKLGKIEAERKVWVGSLAKDTTRGKLVNHVKDLAKPSMVEMMSKGTACIAFKTAEEATTIIESLNGSDLDGASVEFDVWTKKEKKEGEERPKKKKLGIKSSILKQKTDGKKKKSKKSGDSKMGAKMKEKIKAIDNSMKLWIGGLSEKTTWKEVKTHFTDLGCEVDIADVMKPGTAVITFKTDDEATTAMGIANGTEIDGSTIEVEEWTAEKDEE